MPKILHTARYTGTPWEILKSVVPQGFSIETLNSLDYESLLRQAHEADYLLVSGRLPIDRGVLAVSKNLKMIQRTGVGTEMLDLAAIKDFRIPVYVNVGVNAWSVAEHTLALILACLKRLPQINSQTHSGVWNKQLQGLSTHELSGKTVAMVGMGNIGRTVAALLGPFNVNIIYTDVVRQNAEVENRLRLTFFEEFESLLPQADVLSFHCPLTKDNMEMLNRNTLEKIKDGAIVVNTARGKLIEPESLFDALVSGKLLSAALDVHFEEPITLGYKLARLENVILTPHIGGLSYEAFNSMMNSAIGNIVAFERGNFEAIEKNRFQIL